MKSAPASALALVAGLAFSAQAQVINWNAPVSGSWGTAANWNPANIPDVITESAVLGHADPYEVNLHASITIGGLTITNPQAAAKINSSQVLSLAGNLVNNGLVRLASNGSTTSNEILSITVPATFTGTGVVRLEENSDAALSTGVGASITQGAGHSIAGRGVVSALLDNAGVVAADSAGGTLVLNTNPKANSGVFTATAGTLEIAGITVTQTGAGVIRADGGAVNFTSTCTVDGGAIDSTGAGVVHRTAGATTLRAVSNTANMTVASSGLLSVSGGILTNDGLIRMLFVGSTTSNSTMSFAETGTLAGSGEVRLEEYPDAAFSAGAGVIVTQAPTHSITGRGTVSCEMVNNGLLDANVAASTLLFTTVGSTNNGTMRATNGAELQLSAASITQSPAGVIRADASTVTFASTCAVAGGTVESVNGGVVHRESGATTLTSITANGVFTVASSGLLAINGTGITNNALIRVLSNGSTTSDATVRFTATGALSGAGELRLEENTDATFNSSAGAVVTHAASHKITGRGTLSAVMINNGLVDANTTGGTIDLSAAQTNNAIIRSTNGGNIDINGIAITQGPAGVLRADNAQIHFVSTCSVTGGTIEGINGGEINRDSGTTTLTGVTNNGLLTVDASGTLSVPAPAVGDGLTNNGLIRLLAVGSTTANSILTFTGGPATLQGSGEVRLEETTDTIISGTPLTQAASHTISGIGQITTPLTNHGTVAPGNPTTTSTGNLAMNAAYTQSSTGVLAIQLAGTAAAQRDRLTITGAATLSGTLNVTQINGHITPDCSEFIILSATGGVNGTFTTENLPPMALGKMHVVYNPTNVMLRYLPADVNNDGVTDFFDYLDFVAAFDQEDIAADFNNDEVVDFFDYLDFVASLEVGC
jgi:hypothetical protein